MGGYPDFLACPETICLAAMALAGRYFFSINDLGVGNFNPAEHVIPALDEDPAFDRRLTCRGISNPAKERPIDRGCGGPVCQQPKCETQHKAQLHSNCDAELPSSVGC